MDNVALYNSTLFSLCSLCMCNANAHEIQILYNGMVLAVKEEGLAARESKPVGEKEGAIIIVAG